jgi:hypothetical protein
MERRWEYMTYVSIIGYSEKQDYLMKQIQYCTDEFNISPETGDWEWLSQSIVPAGDNLLVTTFGRKPTTEPWPKEDED